MDLYPARSFSNPTPAAAAAGAPGALPQRAGGARWLRPVVWGVAALLALLWTGLAAAGAALVGWGGDAIASGQAAEWGRAAAQFPLPAWLAPWVDPAVLEWTRQLLQWLVEVLPFLGGAVGWLVPVVWVVWGFGLVALLALAGVGHWASGRFGFGGGGRA